MDYYLTVKRKVLLAYAVAWAALKDMLSERSEAQKSKFFLMIMYDFIYEVQEHAQLVCGYDDQKLPLVGGEIGD